MTGSGRDRVGYVQGGRPAFFADPVNDQLFAMVLALLGEVVVLRERLDTHERVAAARGLYRPEDIEAYRPDAAAEAERARLRDEAMARVLATLDEQVARLRDQPVRPGAGAP